MARIAEEEDTLEAKELLAKATPDEMRHTQSSNMPLEFGYTLEHAAKIIGVSKGYTGRLRSAFIPSWRCGRHNLITEDNGKT